MNEKTIQKIQEQTENVQIELKPIPTHEWGTYVENYEYYKKIQVTFANDDLLHITLAFAKSELTDEFCKEVHNLFENDDTLDYVPDITGIWFRFPVLDIDETIKEEIKKIAIKYYLIAKYDKNSYRRRGFDIYKYLEESQ